MEKFLLCEVKKFPKNDSRGKVRNMTFNSNKAVDIVRDIAIALNFEIKEDKDENGNIKGVSAYGGRTIRISDHRTYMQTWVSSGAYKSSVRLDIVIEDEKTEGKSDIQNDVEPFTITEFVYKSSDMNMEKVKLIVFDILNVINGNGYANNARGKKIPITATHAKPSTLTNNNLKEHTIYNKNKIKLRNKMKRTIRLTEGDLRRQVEGALNELDWKTYANAGKKAYDRGQKDRSGRFYDKAMDAYNDKEYFYDYVDDVDDKYDAYAERNAQMWYAGPNGAYGDNNDNSFGGRWALHHRDDDNNYTVMRDGGYKGVSPIYKGDVRGFNWDAEYPDLRDMKNYYTGKSKYIKGKGWAKDYEVESRNRRLTNRITESIIRRLKR